MTRIKQLARITRIIMPNLLLDFLVSISIFAGTFPNYQITKFSN